MNQTIDLYQFQDAFTRMGRADNFSRAGLRALFAYLEDYEESTGEEIELDVIALCCDYSEHASALEAALEYGFEPDSDDDEEEAQEEAALEYLRKNTQVIEVDGGGVIIQGF